MYAGLLACRKMVRYVNRHVIYICTIKSYLFQALEDRVKLAIAEARQALDASDKGDGITSDELERAADDVHATMEAVRSVGLSKSHPLVKEATQLDKTLRNKVTKTKVSAVHVV